MGLSIQILADALGAELKGVDLSRPIDDAVFAEIHRAYLEHLVLVFRDQNLTPAQHIAFSRRFGDLEIHVMSQFLLPDHPEILVLSTDKDEQNNPVGFEDAGRYWHTDLSYLKAPSLGSMLYGIDVPPDGGDTLFANMHAAYDALTDDRKRDLAGKKATHHYASRWQGEAGKMDPRPVISKEQLAKTPPVEQPMIRTHPETGRKAIYAGGFTCGIAGMADEEARPLLDDLSAHATQAQFVYRHKWRPGDLVFWDNRCAMHLATPFDPKYRRHMNRTTIKGDIPY